jgi:hypothetical protein
MATPRILGLPFDSGVDAQVKVRQKQLSVRNRLDNTQQPNNLVVFNSSTSFVRLSSAVSVDGAERLATLKNNLGLSEDDISGYELARNLILWGGVNIAQLPRGIGYDLNSTYGFLSDGAQGLKPVPGITSMTSNYKNNGSLREVTLNIKCFTRKQFEAIEAVYLRLGYTMVVEWGHTDYFLNDNTKSQTTTASLLNLLYPGTKSDKIDPNVIQNKLNENKKNTSYNYDGLLARVVNFSWTLSSDLSYDITLYLISWGDIIDSLKINTVPTANINTIAANEELSENTLSIINNKSLSSLNTLFYTMYSYLIGDQALSTLSEETAEEVKKINELDTERDKIDIAKTRLIEIINKYQTFTDNYAEGTNADNIASKNEFIRVLNLLRNEVNALDNTESFKNYTSGYMPSEIDNSPALQTAAIVRNIDKNYKSPNSISDTDFEDYLQNQIEAAYRINL